MKKTTVIVSALLASIMLLCAVFTASCGEKKDDSGTAAPSAVAISDLEKVLSGKLDLSDMDIMTDAKEDDAVLFTISYGIEDKNSDLIDHFFATLSHRSTDARAIVVIDFKDNATADDIKAVEQNIRDFYLDPMIDNTGRYDPEQNAIALAASFREYPSRLVFVSYDTSGNSEVFDLIEGK